MRVMALMATAIFIWSTGCGGVLKQNSEKSVEDQAVSTEKEYGFGEQDYPNPFSPTAGINFTLVKGDSVKIEIFTIEGDTVGIIADRFFNSGDHFIPLDNIGLDSGVYF